MLPALNIPTLINAPCPSMCQTFPSATASNSTSDIISPWVVFNNTIPFIISLPRPCPFPLPVFSRLPSPLAILWSLTVPCRFLTALHVLLTLTATTVIATTRTAPSTARCSMFQQVVIIIFLVDYPIPIQWSNSHEVAWSVLATAWWLKLCPEIIGTVRSDMLTGAFDLPGAGFRWIGAINLIPKGTGIVPPPIFHSVACLVKHLPHIWAEGNPPHLKRQTPGSAARPHQLELWQVASRDWIKKDYIIKEVPCPLIVEIPNSVYPYVSMDEFPDESL